MGPERFPKSEFVCGRLGYRQKNGDWGGKRCTNSIEEENADGKES